MAWARTALRAGRQVVIANSHGPDSLRSAVAAPGEGAVAGTVEDAVACAIVVLAAPWAAVASAVSGVEWAGRTAIDGTNPLLFPDLTPAPAGRPHIERDRRRPCSRRTARQGRQSRFGRAPLSGSGRDHVGQDGRGSGSDHRLDTTHVVGQPRLTASVPTACPAQARPCAQPHLRPPLQHALSGG